MRGSSGKCPHTPGRTLQLWGRGGGVHRGATGGNGTIRELQDAAAWVTLGQALSSCRRHCRGVISITLPYVKTVTHV